MKKILLIVVTFFIIFTSCTNNDYSRNYKYGKDGLLYRTGTDKLYSGKIIDTTDTFIMEVDIVNGKKNGIYKIFDLSGNVHIHGYLKDNVNEGEWKYFYPNGQVESEGMFENDKPEGKWVFYYQNGIKSEEGNFFKGIRTGTWTFYDTLGNRDSSVLISN